jgi:hypothetical protein
LNKPLEYPRGLGLEQDEMDARKKKEAKERAKGERKEKKDRERKRSAQ